MPKQFEYWVQQPVKSDFDKPLASVEVKGVKIHFSQLSTLTLEQVTKQMSEAVNRYKVRNN